MLSKFFYIGEGNIYLEVCKLYAKLTVCVIVILSYLRLIIESFDTLDEHIQLTTCDIQKYLAVFSDCEHLSKRL